MYSSADHKQILRKGGTSAPHNPTPCKLENMSNYFTTKRQKGSKGPKTHLENRQLIHPNTRI